MGHALGIPVHGVCSLDVLAAARPRRPARPTAELLVATDARRKEVYWAPTRVARRPAPSAQAGPGGRPPGRGLPDDVRALPTAGRGPVLYPDLFGRPLEPLDVDAGAARRSRRAPRRGAGADARRAALPAPPRRPHHRRAGPAVNDPAGRCAGPTSPALVALEAELFPDDAWTRGVAGGPSWRPGRAATTSSREDADGAARGYAGVDLGGEVADVMTIAVGPARPGPRPGPAPPRRAGRARRARDAAAYLMLEVRADNAPARTLYERNGIRRAHRAPPLLPARRRRRPRHAASRCREETPSMRRPAPRPRDRDLVRRDRCRHRPRRDAARRRHREQRRRARAVRRGGARGGEPRPPRGDGADDRARLRDGRGAPARPRRHRGHRRARAWPAR